MITFTVPEAAKVARVHRRTLERAIAAGELNAYKLGPRKTLLWWDDVEEWLKTRPKQPPKKPDVA